MSAQRQHEWTEAEAARDAARRLRLVRVLAAQLRRAGVVAALVGSFANFSAAPQRRTTTSFFAPRRRSARRGALGQRAFGAGGGGPGFAAQRAA